MADPGQAKISPSCCSLGLWAALSTTGPADFKFAWRLGFLEKSLPGSGKFFLGLTFLRMPTALANQAADPEPLDSVLIC
ncbi:MAG: hypothetical protein LW834_12240 [Cyanobium sp. 49614_E6]|jgi:hypothetical protein|nr:hypothetical protein [Cyanobium sp. 49614_E6]